MTSGLIRGVAFGGSDLIRGGLLCNSIQKIYFINYKAKH